MNTKKESIVHKFNRITYQIFNICMDIIVIALAATIALALPAAIIILIAYVLMML